MARLLEEVYRYVQPYIRFIWIGLVILIFIIISVLAYQYYAKKDTPQQQQFKDIANSDRRDKEVNIIFFYVDWCPHCKTSKPEWNSFKNDYDGQNINGYIVKCMDINCTQDNDPKIVNYIQEFQIDGYPTIKLVNGDTKVDFQARVTKKNLESFMYSTLS